MHILNDPSLFLTNRTGAPHDEKLGAAPGINSIRNSTGRARGRPGKSSRNTSGKSQTIVGNAEKKGNASRDPDSNVVTSTFLLNNRYASILFDTGADRSFISTAFSSLINIVLTSLGNSYDVKGNDVSAYTERFQELTVVCTKFVANETEKIDKYICGLPDNIYGNVKSSKPKTLDETINNGYGSHNSHGDNRRNVQTTRPYFYADFMKCQPLNFKGTKGVVGLTRWIEKMESVFNISGCAIENQVKFATCTLLGAALTWWNGQIRTLGPDAYAMTWEVLKQKVTDKYCPQGEIKKLEIELWNLKVKGNDVSA
nr:hypothetical protein [Tanacetum cinerariifolium]